MPRRTSFDRLMFAVAVFLVLGGVLMVGSASNYEALRYGDNPSALLLKHGLHVLLGFGMLFGALAVPYQRLASRQVVGWLLVTLLAALLLVLLMPAVGGARRWIALGPLTIQPSEFAKLVAVVYMASELARKEDRVNDPWAVPLPCLMVVGMLATLILIEPDLGTAVMLVLTATVMIFVAGLRPKYLGILGLLGLAGLVGAIIAEPFRVSRILSFFDRAADPQGAGFQLNQSLIAIGKGGLLGTGLGQGQQKAFYVPAPHTDFIFSVIGEELGFVGTLLVLGAFLFLFWRGVRTALRAPDDFGFYLALGLTVLLVVQALLNMGVCLGLVPTKGLPLPFISYGGSSLLASMIAIGLLLNVSQQSG